jgi:hypothetical protein
MVDVILAVQMMVVRIGVVMVVVVVVMGFVMTVVMVVTVVTGSNFREEMELWFLGRSHDRGPCEVLTSGPDPSHRYIRSERSVILINFCLSIISSNALILIGQTQTRNKVGSLLPCPALPRPTLP